ncbi:hypothetical protein [Bradyrhizobium sp. BR 1432]|uniref:hypothetical protein n=1 Tax=Bradyrhizobium sp. BR 1432 TaxID=3447966 RepID=UPI003EE58854
MMMVRQCMTLGVLLDRPLPGALPAIRSKGGATKGSSASAHQRVAQIQVRKDESVKRMMSEEFAALRTHRNRIHRYRRLLKAQPNGPERLYLERRFGDERSAFDALVACSFPLVFETQHLADRQTSVSAAAQGAIL